MQRLSYTLLRYIKSKLLQNYVQQLLRQSESKFCVKYRLTNSLKDKNMEKKSWSCKSDKKWISNFFFLVKIEKKNKNRILHVELFKSLNIEKCKIKIFTNVKLVLFKCYNITLPKSFTDYLNIHTLYVYQKMENLHYLVWQPGYLCIFCLDTFRCIHLFLIICKGMEEYYHVRNRQWI